jgi:peptidylprolyl isomerase
VLALTACSPTAPSAADCTPTASGADSSAVTSSGDFGSKPEVTVKAPTSAAETQRSVLIQGAGDVAVSGDTVRIQYTLLNGQSGDELAASQYTDGTAEEFLLDEAALLPGIVKTLECTAVGSRVVGVIPAADAFGDSGQPQLGVQAGDDLVFVADVVEIVPPSETTPPADPPLPRADGEDQAPEPGFPTVTLDADGRPTITLPDTAPPTELQIAVLKKGSGAEVAEGSDVVVHYVGLNWNTGEIFDESWARGEPATFNTSGVISGFSAAIVGQTVGSQVIVIIPPADGYGPNGNPPKIGGTDTIVFVVDILGIA